MVTDRTVPLGIDTAMHTVVDQPTQAPTRRHDEAAIAL